MMKFIVSLSLLLSMLSSIGCGELGAFADNDAQSVTQNFEGPTISAAHDCPQQKNNSHHDEAPCGDCHNHSHCHCGFLVISTKISYLSLDSSKGMNYDSLHQNNYIDNLFRPPIA